jgi:NitT/TauT family transport system ATP-binding protein
MTTPALTLSCVSFGYGLEAERVFDRLSLQVSFGEVVSLVGPSGCGKTTLLNLVAGFLRPDSGNIEHRNATNTPRRLGYLFQSDALLPWRTIRANIGLAAEITGIGKDAMDNKILAQLDAFNLDSSVLPKYPGELSGGMRQRIALIQCLMADPHLLLLDEPFAALDFFTRVKLEADIRHLVSDTARAALFVTHDIDEAIAVGDRVVVMGRSPKGVLAEIPIELEGRGKLGPEAVRGHPLFGNYFAQVWSTLRGAI